VTKQSYLLDLIPTGRQNAATAQSLADILGWDVRQVQAEIERLRCDGIPICAATVDKPGFFMPENDAEMRNYAKQFLGRINKMQKSAQVFAEYLDKVGEGSA